MRQARYTVAKAPGVGGTPIPADEPCIVIRGQDKLALAVINFYIDTYNRLSDHDPQVVTELEQHANAIAAWQVRYPTKYADR